jgi:hypothetical protein
MEENMRNGYDRLWEYFGLTRASWITLPRTLMHEMPDKWQMKMAKLLEEWDDYWDWNDSDIGSTKVQITDENNKFMKIPEWLINYRHPNKDKINKLKKCNNN